MLDLETSVAQESLVDGSASGVAPPADSVPVVIDKDCLWVARHAKGWQFGEQGVIEAVVKAVEEGIDPKERCAVEFGAGDGVSLPLTSALVLGRPNWSALFIEADEKRAKRLSTLVPDNAFVLQERVEIDGEGSIDNRMALVGCPKNPALMVIDLDSVDYHIAASMKSRPGILCIETMDIMSPQNKAEPTVPSPDECGKLVGDWFGTQVQANAAAMDALIVPRGYKLVYRTRINSIYLRDDLVPLLRRTTVLIEGVPSLKRPEETGTVDEVYAPLTLNKVKAEDIQATLEEWCRVLKPSGTVRIVVPDIRGVLGEIQNEAANHIALQNVIRSSADGSGFTKESLSSLLFKSGFTAVSDFQPIPGDPTGENLLHITAKKRWYPKVESPRLCLILSQSLLAFTGHERSLMKLSQKLKFETEFSKGSFWDRDMTLATQAAMAKHNPDYLIFSDHDSVFEESDVITLLDAIQSDPTICAIGAVQPSRHHDQPLVLDPTLDYSGDMTRVRFQHFGLTIIRRQVFEEMPQPWFWSVPAQLPNGEWDWNGWTRSDADITFWRNMDLLGMKVYQHNKVNIGHICQCVKYVRDKGKGVQYVPIQNVWSGGKPKDAIFNASLYIPQKLKEGTS